MKRDLGHVAEIELRDQSGKVIERLNAEVFEIQGIELACHKTPGKLSWQATEPISGRIVTRDHVSRESVLDACACLINRYGVQAVLDLIAKARRSPPKR